MFGILVSAFNLVLGFLVKSVMVKFAVFFGLFFITTGFIAVLVSSGLLPSATGLNSSLSSLSPFGAYFFDLFALSTGISMVISAYVTRFIIRRIPLIG
ncbi:DUF2523 family protein [Undibacterium sp.]|uniref:DUF2523 family protein n=1 Tax=Undibacterium sp. TaxID=1914977 RepID=UPI00272FC4DB|nr:DUF2523 family protein [Undibacterium sp.]MDP1978056.1 DUF2523 family protein [Undibacterium sp.]